MTSPAETKNLPLVSVVIASFNSESTLSDTLGSLRAQTYCNQEIIVVDDGSTDHTAELVRTSFPEVQYIWKANGGLPTARNAGIRAARGELIALLDADDICTTSRIAVQVAAMQALPEITLCSSEFSAFNSHETVSDRYAGQYYSQLFDKKGDFSKLFVDHCMIRLGIPVDSKHGVNREIPVHVGDCSWALKQGNFIHPPTIMFRKTLIDEVGDFDEDIRNMCDWEWLVRASQAGKFAYLDYPLLLYRLSENQMSGAKHGLQATLDIVMIRERIHQRCCESSKEAKAQLKRAIGESAIAAADAWLDSRKSVAWRFIAKAARNGAISTIWLKVLLKLILPKRTLNVIRSMRRGKQAFGGDSD